MRVADLIPTVTGSYPKDFLQLVKLVDAHHKIMVRTLCYNFGLPISTVRITTKGS